MTTLVLLIGLGPAVRRCRGRHRDGRVDRQGTLRDLGLAGCHRGDRRPGPRRDARGLRQAIQRASGDSRPSRGSPTWPERSPGSTGRRTWPDGWTWPGIPRGGTPSGSWPGRPSLGIGFASVVGGLLFVSGRALPAILWGAVFGIFGFFLPDLLVTNKAQHRSDAIRKALPDSIDLLTISVESGLAFDAALCPGGAQHRRSTRRGVHPGPQGDPDRQQPVRGPSCPLGAHRRRGPQVFLNSMIQAEKLGIPIADVLRVQAGRDPPEALAAHRGEGHEAAGEDGVPGDVLHHAVRYSS